MVEVNTKCPICGGDISTTKLLGVDNLIVCDFCGSSLKIICLNPVVLEAGDFNEVHINQTSQKIHKSPCCPYCGEKNLRMRKRNSTNVFICLKCEIELEVIEVNPIKLVLSSDDSWDYDEYEYSY